MAKQSKKQKKTMEHLKDYKQKKIMEQLKYERQIHTLDGIKTIHIDNPRELFSVIVKDKIRDVSEYLMLGFNINIQDDNGHTPLWAAVDSCYMRMIKFILHRGADMYLGDRKGSTPFHHACMMGNLDCIKLMVEKYNFDINYTNKFMRSGLWEAATSGSLSIIDYLISKGADVNIIDVLGGTALMSATMFGHFEIVSLLLANGADVNVKGVNGNSILTYACISHDYFDEEGKQSMIKELIEAGADVNSVTDDGKTVLDRVYEENDDPWVIECLKEHGAKASNE